MWLNKSNRTMMNVCQERNKVASHKWNLPFRRISIWQQCENRSTHISLMPSKIHTFALLCIDTMKYRFIYMVYERSWFALYARWWKQKMWKQNNQKCFQTMLTLVHFLYANVINISHGCKFELTSLMMENEQICNASIIYIWEKSLARVLVYGAEILRCIE